MRVRDLNWLQLEAYLKHDDRIVLPSLPYGLTPYFAAYPGSPTLTVPTYRAVVRELLDSLHGQGFRRFSPVAGSMIQIPKSSGSTRASPVVLNHTMPLS